MAYVDGIDSHYQWVKSRILKVNPSRIVAGMLAAQDWPPKKFKTQAFYLLDLSDTPAARPANSATITTMSELLQWVWIIEGTPIQGGQQASNRGDRFRINMQMKGELINGLFPSYCEKQTWTEVNGVWTPTSLNPKQSIFWTTPEFKQNSDKNSGLIYGMASLRLVTMLDAVTA